MMRLLLWLIAILMAACEVPKEPDFTARITVPLANNLFGISDLQEELVKDNDSLALEIVQDSVILAISDFEKFNVDEDLAEDPIFDSTTAVFNNNIRIRDSSTATFQLGSLAPTAVDTLHGKNSVIPSFNIPTTQRNISFSNFSSMTVDSGSIRIVVTNNTQTRDSLHVTVYRFNNVRIDSFYTGPLTTGQAVTRLISAPFSGGATITTPVLVRVRGGSTGSSGVVVNNIDTTRAITVKVVFDVKNSSVTGTFPSQTIDKVDSVRSSSNSVIDTGYIAEGRMFMAFSNINLPVASVVTFVSPDFIDPSGNPLTRVVNVPAGNNSVARDTVNLNGWQVRPKPSAIGNQHFGYSYTLVSQTSANPSNTISNGAGVKANVTLDTLFFNRLSGLITQEELTLDERSETLDIGKIDTINLSQAYFEVYAEHRIPFPTALDILITGKKKSGASRSSTLTGNLRPYTGGLVQRDTIRTPVSQYDDVAAVLSLLPDSIKLSGTAMVGDNVTRGAIVKEDSLSFRVFLRAPLVFSLPNAPTRNLIRSKPNELDLSQDIEDLFRDNIKQFRIRGTVTNAFPVPIAVRFLVNNIANEDSFYTVLKPDTTFLFPDSSAIIIDKGQVNASGVVIQPKVVDLDYVLPDSSFNKLFKTETFRKKYRGLQVQLLTTNGIVRVTSNDFARIVSHIEMELLVDEALRD